MKHFTTVGAALLAGLLMLTGCGSSSSSGGDGKTTGHLIDSPVAGITYECDGTAGTTSATGEFLCTAAPVTFKLGGMTLGTITAFTGDNTVYPQDLAGVGRYDFTDPKVIKLSRLLQSLDDDGDISEAITITEAMAAHFTADATLDDALSDLVARAGTGITIVSEGDAIRHLQASMGSPHPGETEMQAKARYLEDIKATNADLNTSDPVINTNLVALAECLYGKDPTLRAADITATFGAGVREEDVNTTSGIDCDGVTVRKVGGMFADSLNVLYYTVNNPITNNEQLLAYDYDNDRSHVVNTNVILGNKVFLLEGEKDENQEKITGKRHGIYLDPNQAFEVRQHTEYYHGFPSTFAYNFYTDNALMKFDVKNPSTTSNIFKSDQIPTTLSGVTKIGKNYKVLENVVDPDDSYIGLTAFESLADDIKGENEDNKTQAAITVRVGDSKAVAGKPIALIKDDAMMTTGVLVSYAAAHNPTTTIGTFELWKYNAALTSGTKITDGKYLYATHNATHIYLFKEGSSKIYAYQKDGGTDLAEVAGVNLAGNFDEDTHAKASRHGSSTKLIDGASTVSGRKPHLGSGNDAYVAFHYDLQADIGEAFVFGSFGAYKSAQVFKLTGTAGTKIMDNGDGVDDSANPTNEANNGHINLIAVAGGKVYAERGWWDGSATLGGTCTQWYPYPGSGSTACFHVKYGYLDTSVADAADITVLQYDDTNMTATNLPYYVSRRIAPLASGDKLYISLFKGGSQSSGYIHEQYQFNLADASSVKSVTGRTYFNKTHQSNSGIFDGKVIAFSQTAQTIFDVDSETVLADTSDINGKPGFSVSAVPNGVPLAGIGDFAMLQNNIGNHAFEMFAVDVETTGLRYIDFAPYGGWLYE